MTADSNPIGYDDTPYLPETPWRVHDAARPQPPVVTPGAAPSDAPSDAIVLFDGTSLAGWVGRDGEPGWLIEGSAMEVVPGTGDIETEAAFGDCQLHVEWAAPAEVAGDSQGRGNSGVFLMGRYEIQVLDGYNNPTYADGAAAAIYGQYPPQVNACRPPGEWQAYDVLFLAPRWEGTDPVRPAQLTVLHNGVVVHHARAAMGPTLHGQVADYALPHSTTGPLKLQDHGDLVRYRNIWIRPLLDQAE